MPTAAPADDIILCQPTDEKKRKKVDAAANNESDTPKKRYRYECTAEGCSNHVVNGGVCYRHGAKVAYKRCNREGCSKYAMNGGVCVTHGATKKRCSVDGCTNQVQKRGVCIRHGAKVERKRCSFDGCSNKALKGGVCIRHGALGDRCRFEGCTYRIAEGDMCISHLENFDLDFLQQLLLQQRSMESASVSSSLGHHHHLQQQLSNNYCQNDPFLNSNRNPRCNVEGCKIAPKNGICWLHGLQLVAPLAQANDRHGYVLEGDNRKNHPAVEKISDDKEVRGEKLPPIGSRKQKDSVIEQSKTAAFSDAGEATNSEQKIAENKGIVREKNKPDNFAVGGENSRKDDEEPEDTSDQARGKKMSGLSEIAGGDDNDDDGGGGDYDVYEAEDDSDGAELGYRADIVGGVTANVEKESTHLATAEPDSRMVPKTVDDYSAQVIALKARLEISTRNEASLRREKEQLNAHLKTSAVELKEMTTKVDALNATLAKVTGNETVLNARLQKETADFAAERASLQSKVEELTAKLEQATRNEAEMNARLETMADELEATRTSSESAREKLQSKIDELLVMLDGRQNKVSGKSEAIGRLPLELTRKYTELNAKSTEAAALNVRLVEQAQGGDITKDSKEDIIRSNVNTLLPISYEHFCQSISSMDASVAQDDSQMYDDGNNDYEKSKDGIVVKEGELTDDEYVAGRLKGVKEEELTDDEA